MRSLLFGSVLLGGCWSKYDDCGNSCACLNTCSSTSEAFCADLSTDECAQRADCLVIEGRELTWPDTGSDCYERGSSEPIGCIDAAASCLPDTRLSQSRGGVCYEIEGCAPEDFVPCMTSSMPCP